MSDIIARMTGKDRLMVMLAVRKKGTIIDAEAISAAVKRKMIGQDSLSCRHFADRGVPPLVQQCRPDLLVRPSACSRRIVSTPEPVFGEQFERAVAPHHLGRIHHQLAVPRIVAERDLPARPQSAFPGASRPRP